MRDYAKVAPSFWTRGSGKRLRGDLASQVLALYLVTCPSANMTGIYYVPFVTIAHETGLNAKDCRAALDRLKAAGFAEYDYDAELVWVPNAAAYQLGDGLELKDNRRAGITRELATFGQSDFVRSFYLRYAAPYNLTPPEWCESPLQAPPKPLASPLGGARNQEIEQEIEIEMEGASPGPLNDDTYSGPPDGKSATMRVAPRVAPAESFTLAPSPTPGARPDKAPKVAKVATTIDPDWQVTPALAEHARLRKVDAYALRDSFVDHYVSRTDKAGKPLVSLDWAASFRTWIAKSIEFGKAPPYREPTKPYVPRPMPGYEPPADYQPTPDEMAKLMGTVSRMFSGDMSDPDEETAKERAS
jgi:hypothetical protein